MTMSALADEGVSAASDAAASGKLGKAAATGAGIGGTIGSVVPGIGNVVGSVIGAIAGALSSLNHPPDDFRDLVHLFPDAVHNFIGPITKHISAHPKWQEHWTATEKKINDDFLQGYPAHVGPGYVVGTYLWPLNVIGRNALTRNPDGSPGPDGEAEYWAITYPDATQRILGPHSPVIEDHQALLAVRVRAIQEWRKSHPRWAPTDPLNIVTLMKMRFEEAKRAQAASAPASSAKPLPGPTTTLPPRHAPSRTPAPAFAPAPSPSTVTQQGAASPRVLGVPARSADERSMAPEPAALSDAFFARLAELGQRHATDPDVFLDVWNSESSLDPRATNPKSNAQGLNQMMPATLKGLGAPADFKSLAGEDQLPWIERLIASGERLNGGPFRSAARYYHSNFFPRTMYRGQSPATIVVASDATDPEERAAYMGNAGMDPSGKGRITYADFAAFLNLGKNRNRVAYEAARARLAAAARGGSSPPALPKGGAAPVLVGVGLLVALVAWSGR